MKFGLIGYPIGHSLSPQLFNSAYPDIQYDLIEMPDFEEAMALFRQEYDAVNVTAPFKERAFHAADRADKKTAVIGAANILRKEKDGSISAFNSDYSAVISLLEHHMPAGAPRRAMVVGCGGAGKAAALAALDFGLETIVTNRTIERAEEFCRRAGGAAAVGLEEACCLVGSCGIVIYTLPVRAEIARLIENSRITCIEANYRTPSLKGGDIIAGEEWLKFQADEGFVIMTQTEPRNNG